MKKFFFKKKRKSKIPYIFLIIILFVFIYFQYIQSNNELFLIEEFNNNFFIVPGEKGGKKIINTDKKVLHFDKQISEINENQFSNINYSIQLFSSEDYKLVEENFITFKKKFNLNHNDLFIVAFRNSLNTSYLLIYKNFKNRKEANLYCLNNINFLTNCLIINVESLK